MVELAREEEVRKLLMENRDVDVNWQDSSDGWTGLHYASQNGHDKIVRMLLAHPDIDVNLKDYDGSTPFLWTCREGDTLPVLICCSRMPGSSSASSAMTDPLPFGRQPRSGHLEVIKVVDCLGKGDGSGTARE